MARYSALLGRRVNVQYREGDISVPATGVLAADSGRFIFLEESYGPQQNLKTFRWEISYKAIIEIAEIAVNSPGGAAGVVSPSTS